ncbi:Hypothetical protein NTJ_04087 [Nesidiocoris tenuis]|uniref:Uncharacterized protein n=1 Tax=Nesidiocoris tenuis TaxID=355587 RepID=A0ABN7AIT0_9HEMI|nr:Hypothetical protein NTJ_04087 [Nesidiocoris tenuis]
MERESVSEGERDGDSVRECASERERSERCQVRARGRRSGGARGWETAQSAARKGLSADSGAPRGGEGGKTSRVVLNGGAPSRVPPRSPSTEGPSGRRASAASVPSSKPKSVKCVLATNVNRTSSYAEQVC